MVLVAVINKKRSPLSHVGRWAAELLLVFVGVYAAFWLNNYQQHGQDAERRDRILASLEQELRRGIDSGKLETAKEERKATEFRHGLDAGEMPPLQPFVFTTDYSPGANRWTKADCNALERSTRPVASQTARFFGGK